MSFVVSERWHCCRAVQASVCSLREGPLGWALDLQLVHLDCIVLSDRVAET